MKATIREKEGFHVGPTGELVGFDEIVNFNIEVDVSLNVADEPFLVVFDDGSWSVHNAVESFELIDDEAHAGVVHQAIPFNAIFREFIAWESQRPILNLEYATPAPALNGHP